VSIFGGVGPARSRHERHLHLTTSVGAREPGGQRLTLVAMTLASGVTSLPTAALVVALAVIHGQFSTSLSELQWTLTGDFIAYSALLIAAGRLADIYGRRLLLVVGTAIYLIATVVAALAPNATVLIFGMVGVGAGAAVLTPASLSIVTDAYPPARRGAAIGVWGAATGVVWALGPAIGGVLVDDLSWRWIFWVQVPVIVAILVLTLIGVRESRDPQAERRVDVPGLVLSAGGLLALSLALNQAPTWGWSSAAVIGLLIGAGLLLVAFVLVEPRVRAPLVDFGFFRKRNFAGANVVVFVMNFVLGALLFFLPLYFQELLDYSPLEAGLLLLPLSATMSLAMPVGGPLATRFGPRPPITVGLALMAVAMLLLSDISESTRYRDLWPPMALLGLGSGFALTPMNLAAMNSIVKRKSGGASGVLITLSGVGATFGVAVSGAVFQAVQRSRTAELSQQAGVPMTESAAGNLDGVLAGSASAQQALASYGAKAAVVTDAVREAFVSALATTMQISAGVAVVGLILTALLMGKMEVAEDDSEPAAQPPAPDR
jgi:EmrB/QacA subfamily drug resistance transporter